MPIDVTLGKRNLTCESTAGIVGHEMEATKDRGVEVWGACDDQAQDLFHEAALYYLNMTGAEFIEAWDSGKVEDPERPEVVRVVMLLPFVR